MHFLRCSISKLLKSLFTAFVSLIATPAQGILLKIVDSRSFGPWIFEVYC